MSIDCGNPKDIELLKIYSKNGICNYKESSTPFGKTSPIYMFSNEPMPLIFNEDLTNKKVLSVTASGDQMLNIINCGATDITCFDINVFAKYYAMFKIAMIKRFDYKKFMLYINYIKDATASIIMPDSEYEKLNLNSKFYNKVIKKCKPYLDKTSYEFISLFYEILNGDIPYMRKYVIGVAYNSSFYKKEEDYLSLKRKLNDVSIKFVDADIFKVPELLSDKFDYIYLSNIPEYIHKYRDLLIYNFLNLLNEDGKILEILFLNSSLKYEDDHIINEKKFLNDDITVLEHKKRK